MKTTGIIPDSAVLELLIIEFITEGLDRTFELMPYSITHKEILEVERLMKTNQV